MTTLRQTLGRWWPVFAGLYLILVGIATLFGLAVPALLLGLVALIAGICCLLAS